MTLPVTMEIKSVLSPRLAAACDRWSFAAPFPRRKGGGVPSGLGFARRCLSRFSKLHTLSMRRGFPRVYLKRKYDGLSSVGSNAERESSFHLKPGQSPESRSFTRSRKIFSGMPILMTSCLRRVFLVGGRTSAAIEWMMGSENQCFGTWMYSIKRGGFASRGFPPGFLPRAFDFLVPTCFAPDSQSATKGGGRGADS